MQCKHWSARQVGIGVVRELNGVVAASRAAGGFVVTGGTFTRRAWQFSQKSGVELIDGVKLESWSREAGQKRAEDTIRATPGPVTETPALTRAVELMTCPKCGSGMVRRVAKLGAYGDRSSGDAVGIRDARLRRTAEKDACEDA